MFSFGSFFLVFHVWFMLSLLVPKDPIVSGPKWAQGAREMCFGFHSRLGPAWSVGATLVCLMSKACLRLAVWNRHAQGIVLEDDARTHELTHAHATSVTQSTARNINLWGNATCFSYACLEFSFIDWCNSHSFGLFRHIGLPAFSHSAVASEGCAWECLLKIL